MTIIARIIADQDGVISRRQLLSAGARPHDVKRMLRRRDLAPIAPGVYVHHTGEPEWIQSAWAALLAVSSDGTPTGVALSHWSAVRVAEGPGRSAAAQLPLHVAIPIDRRVRPPSGIVVHRTDHLDSRLHPGRMPPRIRYEDALLDVAASLPPLDAVAILARAVGARRSTAGRLLSASRARPRIRQRRWLEAVLADIAQGSHSVLEHGFLDQVLRPHRLPMPARQLREHTATGVVYRDAAYGSLLIELDGRIHEEQRDADLDRDLHALASGRTTVRLGWGQVFARPCGTARALSLMLGCGAPCGDRCSVGT